MATGDLKQWWTGGHSHFLFALGVFAIVGAFAAVRQQGDSSTDSLILWVGCLIVIVAGLIVIGDGLQCRWLGVLIDDRNRMSLSRPRLVLGTIVVLASFIAFAVWNMHVQRETSTEDGDPLAIGIPGELWWTLGISTTSLIGSPLILGGKKYWEVNAAEAAATLMQVGRKRNVAIAFLPDPEVADPDSPPADPNGSSGSRRRRRVTFSPATDLIERGRSGDNHG